MEWALPAFGLFCVLGIGALFAISAVIDAQRRATRAEHRADDANVRALNALTEARDAAEIAKKAYDTAFKARVDVLSFQKAVTYPGPFVGAPEELAAEEKRLNEALRRNDRDAMENLGLEDDAQEPLM